MTKPHHLFGVADKLVDKFVKYSARAITKQLLAPDPIMARINWVFEKEEAERRQTAAEIRRLVKNRRPNSLRRILADLKRVYSDVQWGEE